MWLKDIFIAWISGILLTFLSEIDTSYTHASVQYNESIQHWRGCTTEWEYRHVLYAEKCQSLRDPPAHFISVWFHSWKSQTEMMKTWKWCGIVHCSQLLTTPQAWIRTFLWILLAHYRTAIVNGIADVILTN